MKVALAFLALLPFAAHAEVVVLEYSGTVTRLVNNPRTSVTPGNVLGGWLYMDTQRAGADQNPSHKIGFWGSKNKNQLVDFVAGGSRWPTDPARDFVSIKNRGSGEIDEFRILDDEADGEGLELAVSLRDFLEGDRLDQAFVFRRPAVNEPGESMIGKLFTAPGRFVEFAITRIRVAPPGRCSAP